MNRLQHYFKEYHPIVHTLLFGTMLARIAGSMSNPFIALYLYLHMNLSPELIGLTVGVGALAGTLGGFVGGTLSDRFGRRKVMMASLYTWGLVFIGFALTDNIWVFLLLSTLNGLCKSFFEPVAQALMGDLTPPDKRFRVFSLRYAFVNFGVAIGPLIGAGLGISAGAVPFVITGVVYLLYAAVLFSFLKRFGIESLEAKSAAKERVTFRQALHVISHDVSLRWFLIGATLGSLAYVQFTVSLSQIVEQTVVDGIILYSWLMTTNAVVVVLTSMLLTRWAEKRPPIHAIFTGNVLYMLGCIGFAFSGSWAGFIIATIVFTLGEVLTFPSNNMLIDRLAPEGMRGAYYGANSFKDFGKFLGPWLGGLLLSSYGGSVMFLAVGAITLGSTLFYRIGLSRNADLFTSFGKSGGAKPPVQTKGA